MEPATSPLFQPLHLVDPPKQPTVSPLPPVCPAPAAAADPAIADWAGPLQTLQAFDGPVPETLNGRLCMLSVPIALWEEWQTGNGMLEQVAAHPERIIGITLLIALATYVPAFRWGVWTFQIWFVDWICRRWQVHYSL